MNIEQINQLFSKYGLTNFNKFKNYYKFESNGSDLKISNTLFEKMLDAVNNASDPINILIPNFTFGIEFEFVGSDFVEDIANFNTHMIELVGDSYSYEKRYCHNSGLDWLLGKDGSIKYESTRGNLLFGYELSTPKLLFNKESIDLLKKVLNYIKEDLNGEVNKSCGTHIHIGFDCSKIFRHEIETLLLTYSSMESTVFDPIVPISRRRNRYCKATSPIIREKYRKLSARYCKFNFDCECKVFHVECRQLEGTLDLDTIINWLRLQSSVIYDIINHIDDCEYLYKLRNSNAFDILFKYNFNKELVSFFIKRIIEFKSKSIQLANNTI